MNAATRIDFTVVSIVVWTHSKALGPMILTLQRRNGCRSGAESIACCKPSISPYPGIAVLTVTGTTHSHGPPAGPRPGGCCGKCGNGTHLQAAIAGAHCGWRRAERSRVLWYSYPGTRVLYSRPSTELFACRVPEEGTRAARGVYRHEIMIIIKMN